MHMCERRLSVHLCVGCVGVCVCVCVCVPVYVCTCQDVECEVCVMLLCFLESYSSEQFLNLFFTITPIRSLCRYFFPNHALSEIVYHRYTIYLFMYCTYIYALYRESVHFFSPTTTPIEKSPLSWGSYCPH